MKRLGFGALTATVTLTLTGCYTTTNTAKFTPLQTNYPVSASEQYIAGDGAIVTPTQYDTVKAFKFATHVDGKVHDTTETRLELEPQLDRIMKRENGDAMTRVKIQAVDYDHGSHLGSASFKILGWTFGITGATLAVVGAATPDRDDGTSRGKGLMVAGGIFAGVGVLSYLAGLASNDPAQWKFEVSGQVVRRNSVPTAPPTVPVAAPAAPAAPGSGESLTFPTPR